MTIYTTTTEETKNKILLIRNIWIDIFCATYMYLYMSSLVIVAHILIGHTAAKRRGCLITATRNRKHVLFWKNCAEVAQLGWRFEKHVEPPCQSNSTETKQAIGKESSVIGYKIRLRERPWLFRLVFCVVSDRGAAELLIYSFRKHTSVLQTWANPVYFQLLHECFSLDFIFFRRWQRRYSFYTPSLAAG